MADVDVLIHQQYNQKALVVDKMHDVLGNDNHSVAVSIIVHQ